MDAIEFVAVEVEDAPASCTRVVVDILVNGVRLAELARSFEDAHYGQGISRYVGLPLDIVSQASRCFLEEDPDSLWEGKMQLLQCDCFELGCWPLICRVDVSDTVVTWSDFEQPHRGPDSQAGHWTYEGFCPFVFDRQQYEQALKSVRR